MIIDAVVLAGGRSSRLGGTAKAGLEVDGRTLLERTLDALGSVRSVVVVGDPAVVAQAAPGRALQVIREVPAFAGPAAAIGAGIACHAARGGEPSELTFVLACDMPGVGAAVKELLGAVADPPADRGGVVAVSTEGRLQYLVGLYPTAALAAAARAVRELANLSARALLAGLGARPVMVPSGTTDDIDTWEDAQALHVVERRGHA